MRRRASFTLAALMAIAWLGIPFAIRRATGPSTITRHEDPATAAPDGDPSAIFERYRAALSPFAAGQFAEGRRLLAELNGATLSPEAQSAIRELNALLTDEGNMLETADALLRKASALIAAGDLRAAQPLLAQLDLYTRRGNALLDEGSRQLSELAHRTNVETLPRDAPQRRAYEDLQRTAARARALMLSYRAATQHPKSMPALARLLPYQTTIELSSPPSVYPGRAFTISGGVREQAPTPSRGRRLTLQFDGQVLAELPSGQFRQTVTLPRGTFPGSHSLSAVIAPKGRYLGTSAYASLRVIQAVPALQVRTPGVVLAPGRLAISGNGNSEFGPVANATVRARVGRLTVEGLTSKDGDFRLVLELPASLSLVGRQSLALQLIPMESWYSTTEQRAEPVFINLIAAGFVTLVVPIAGFAYGTYRRRQQGPEKVLAVPSNGVLQFPAPDLGRDGHLPQPSFNQLLAVYVAALGRVQRDLGVPMQRYMTLREFAVMVRQRLKSTTFIEMTTLAELALYSSVPLTQEHEEQIRGLADKLDLELRDVA